MENTPSVISSLLAGLILDAGQLLFGVGDVFVTEDENLGAREAAAVDDRSVIQFVGDDEVVFAQKCRHRARVGGESRLEDHAGFDVLEARDLFFQFHVDLHGAGDGAHRARSDAVFARGFERRLAQFGMRRQPEVIVRGEVDDLLAVEGADRGLLVVEHAQLEVRALGLEFVELVGRKKAGWCGWRWAWLWGMFSYHAPSSVLYGSSMSAFRYYFDIQRVMPTFSNLFGSDPVRLWSQMSVTAPFYAGVAFSAGALMWKYRPLSSLFRRVS
jgi:hypothetical protein